MARPEGTVDVPRSHRDTGVELSWAAKSRRRGGRSFSLVMWRHHVVVVVCHHGGEWLVRSWAVYLWKVLVMTNWGGDRA
jgi:hypothetical protein